MNQGFYKNKKVLLTGHTGFKGTWLTKILLELGAEVLGYALPPQSNQILFKKSQVADKVINVYGDIRDYDKLYKTFEDFRPDIVFHLAAQPLVRESYAEPRYTYEVNVMGTVNICECIRSLDCVKSFLNITTDKVYLNNEWEWGYRENEPLDGYDPYSNSKSCSELVTHCYVNSYFHNAKIPVSTARAGNVIGGGDFSKDRILPDCVRYAVAKEDIVVRNPNSVRPYQHVLEPLKAYLLIAQKQYDDISYSGYYNVGPQETDCITTGELVSLFCKYWKEDVKWTSINVNGPHEANFLKLDCSKLKNRFDWKPTWNVEDAVEKTVEMYKSFVNEENISDCMKKQILEFFG